MRPERIASLGNLKGIDVSKLGPEDYEQVIFQQWVNDNLVLYPQLEAMYHIKNEFMAKTSYYSGKLAVAKGVKSGVWDNHLPVPMFGWSGLWLELKAQKNTVTPNQKKWGEMMKKYGHFGRVCWGAEAMIKVCKDYMDGVYVKCA